MDFDYIINNMLIFAIIGMCIKMFFGNTTSTDGSTGSANSTIWGYGISALSLLALMFINYAINDQVNSVLQKNNTGNILDFLKNFITSSAPTILTISTFVWIILINMKFFEKINKGSVAKEYYQLSTGTSILFIFQLICLFQYLKVFIGTVKNKYGDKNQSSSDEYSEGTQKKLMFATYFIAIVNLIVVGMMTIILEFFSTDG